MALSREGARTFLAQERHSIFEDEMLYPDGDESYGDHDSDMSATAVTSVTAEPASASAQQPVEGGVGVSPELLGQEVYTISRKQHDHSQITYGARYALLAGFLGPLTDGPKQVARGVADRYIAERDAEVAQNEALQERALQLAKKQLREEKRARRQARRDRSARL